jgi:HD-GYP domain-containing protein (c-di-GMP phosphodiesterase class II)
VVRELWEAAARHGRVPERTAAEVVAALGEGLVAPEPLVSLVRHPDVEGYLPRHAVNVSVLSMALARFLGHDEEDVLAVGKAALVHNVGQTALPRSILEKRGELGPEEWEAVQDHPRIGAEILAPWADELPARVSREHHVTLHGGYPREGVPERIHPVSRIVQVCDVYEALSSPRPYRDAWRVERAMEFLRRRSGTHFDPVFVTGFQRMGRLWLRRVLRSEADGSDAELEFRASGDTPRRR